jgi:NCAIR mutase (PurE)-related protein
MDKISMLNLLRSVKDGTVSPEDAANQLKIAPFEDLGFAKVDHHRAIRQGVGEVIYGKSKTPEQILKICESLIGAGAQNILVTRIEQKVADYLGESLTLNYNTHAGIAVVNPIENQKRIGSVAVVSAGTSDMPVCEEAAITAEALGSNVIRIYDAGVSGIHRLLAHAPELAAARAVVVVAGMEGALASVVGGLVDCPVIAVPTSVGYGASFHGVAALLAMLNSCASGVSVVNIDNGFGGGYIAHLINATEGVK